MSQLSNTDQVLVSWIGAHDLKAVTEGYTGPIIDTLSAVSFTRAELIFSYPESQTEPYLQVLRSRFPDAEINARFADLASPVDYEAIYHASRHFLQDLVGEGLTPAILISPGTPAMQAIWILLGKTQFPSRFYQASREKGVEQVKIPFEIAAEYIPSATHLSDKTLQQLNLSEAPTDAAFDNIITQNPVMLRLKQQAQILAHKDVPVLIDGETGTGKELFARAIHNASSRKDQPFIAVNCGAFAPELVDSMLFGHKKGAFTGANRDQAGVFEQADGGTLFLDEFAELTPAVQVRLLRVLQEKRFTPLGSQKEQRSDFRLITATHKNLIQEVSEGRFREDLFYRIAVGVLHLPPLRQRQGDLILLADNLLAAMAKQDGDLLGSETEHKKISAEAKKVILNHPWPGNIRELRSTLLRASLWSEGDSLSASELQNALFQQPDKPHDIMQRDISQGVDIQGIIAEICQHYIPQALVETGQNKTEAAQLLGLKNYQTLNNWMQKYGIS